VASWVALAYLVLSFYILVLPALLLLAQIAFGVAYTASFLAVFGLGLSITVSDPTDPLVAMERRARLSREQVSPPENSLICTVCKTHVQEHSKHCGCCDRCVNGFDHHCNWLNNCIGRQNYRRFVLLIIALQVFTSLHIGAVIFLSVKVLTHCEEEQNVEDIYHSEAALVALVVASACVSTGIWVFNCRLISLHIWLYRHNMTTYENILKVRAKDRSRAAPKRSTISHDETRDRPQFAKTLDLEMILRPTSPYAPSSHHLLNLESPAAMLNKTGFRDTENFGVLGLTPVEDSMVE
jgi:palmitoyltransferase